VKGQLELSNGTVSAIAAFNARMDAAVAGEVAGFELVLERANVREELGPDFRPGLTLNVTLAPIQMRALGLLLLYKGGSPAFNEREWRDIANALRNEAVRPGGLPTPEDTWSRKLLAYVQRIEEAYS